MTTENNGATATPAPDAAAAAAAAELVKQGTGATGAPEQKPAPVAPTGEPSELNLEADDGPKGTIVYKETGDKGLDMALGFFGKQGISPEQPSMIAAIQGDFSLLRAELSEKNIPGAEAYIALAEKAYQKFHTEHEARRAEDKKAVLEVVGGEERWADIQKWVKEKAEPAEAEGIRAALSAGGIQAKMAATFLAVNFDKATGAAETQGAGPSAAGENKGAAASASGALSPQEYGAEVLKARQAHKPRDGYFEDSKAYKDLRDRRARWKA